MKTLRMVLIVMAVCTVTSAAAQGWHVSAAMKNLQIDRNGQSTRQIVEVVLSVMDQAGKPVTGLRQPSFELRAQTCAADLSVRAENNCRLGKPLTFVRVREMELPGTYYIGTSDTSAALPFSQGVVVLRVFQPAIPAANQPAQLRSQLVLMKTD